MSSATRSFPGYHLKTFIAGCFLIAAISSCKVPIVVKKYPVQKPFVYETNINLIGNFSSKERESLETSLKAQLDDSIQVRKVDKLLWAVMKNPPVYDSTNADKSIIFMKALLISLGYFDDSIGYRDTVIKKGANQYRTVITFDVAPRRLWLLDTVVYSIRNADLQRLTDSTRKEALIKKGDPFAKGPISAEIDRLTELYQNNGYLRFGRDELIGVWDTLDVSLLQPTLDPLEQLQLLQRLRERREKPTVKLEIRLRTEDSTKLTRYYNGSTTIYPDYVVDLDTTNLRRRVNVDTAKKITVIQYRNKFKPKIFPPNIYLPPDSLYRLRRYIRTVNRLNLLGTWRLVNIDRKIRPGTDTVDFDIRLTPAKKFSFTTNLEGSINQSAISGRLFGIGINAGVQNRNFARTASFDSWNARYGIEFGSSGKDQFIQTQTLSIGRNIVFPRAILLNRYIRESRRDNYRTSLGGNISNTERRSLYNQTTINASWAYEYQRRNKLIVVKFPNVEYSVLKKRPTLDTLLLKNPSLRNIFTDGLIVSTIGNMTITLGGGNNLGVFRANVEEAGLLTGLFRDAVLKRSPFLDTNLYRFVKADVEYARLLKRPKSSLALRAFLGVGYEFNSTRNPLKKNTLPFFKQYFSGGPNSMRAWALRRLGPGSSVKDFTGEDGTPDRYGDIQFEANAEYRFPIGRPLGIKVNGAVFTDIGNIWLLKKQAGPPEEVFQASRFANDLAVGAGAGLRIDFNFFVVRLDYSYKVRDPSPSLENATVQNKWFGYSFFKGDQFQLGIGYPFIF